MEHLRWVLGRLHEHTQDIACQLGNGHPVVDVGHVAAEILLTSRNTDTPKLDLDSYIQNYRGMVSGRCLTTTRLFSELRPSLLGRTRTSRLLLIASTSTVLAVDALKLAAQEIIRTGKDTQQYRLICDELKSLAPHDPDAKFNRQWAEQTDKANHAEQQRLETQLRAYKNNLVKESIRVRLSTSAEARCP